MATKTAKEARLVIVYETGKDAKDNPILKSKSYKGLHPDVTPDKVLAVGNAITSLQQYPVNNIEQDITFAIEG